MNKKIKFIFFSAGVFALFFFNIKTIFADSTDCSTLTGDAQDQCESLNKKAKIYQELIDLKNKQQSTLATQVEIINREQEANRIEIRSAQKQADDMDRKIQDLEDSIKQKEDEVTAKKQILAALVQSYYEYDQQGVLDLVMLDQDFSETFSQADYNQQSSTRVSEVLDTILKDRNEMTSQRDELNQQREESNKIKEALTNKNAALESSESQKQSLLTKTQGEEEKYQKLLAHVEEQKKELFNFSEASNADEVSASVNSYPAPKDHLASTSWYFSQKDSRWGDKRIGNSSSLMKDYGCAVTSVSMVLRKKGAGIDPGKMAGQKIFYYDLIKWPDTWSPGIALVSSISHGNINWKTIDTEIAKGNPVIAYIGKTNGGGGHYVVITGKDSKDYIVHDPYFGANLYLGTSKALVGKIGKDSGVKMDQMIIYH